ncbi:MAG: glycoside hydrolase family 3 C-terminal domain-containing protein [Vicinamibacteria bacterium]
MEITHPGRSLSCIIAVALSTLASAQAPLPYSNLDLSFEARAKDLVSRMTSDEKISQLMNNAPAIPRLDVPAYEWWNEGLHGVARAGVATVFPQAIGLAATFDLPLMHEVATAISDEARAKHHEFLRHDERRRYQGLTYWSPNINIFRDPRWGRGQETYGEDPYLTSRMGVEFVKGLQGDDPKYLKLVATAKHFAVHSGPEADRHHFDARPSERDLFETYLPAFQALVQEGKAASVMGAYNRINGESGSASQRLLQDILRRDWGFQGYVVSDCASIDDIYKNHKIVATPEEAAALGVTKGCDLECGNTYKSLRGALDQGLLKEQDLDVALTRLMTARFRLGMFDPPERVAFARIPYSENESPAHDALARRTAQASIVLLKNNGILPLSKASIKTVGVIGPNSDELMTLLGNYYGVPSKPVTILAGIRAAVAPGTIVLTSRGTELVEGRQDPRAVPPIESSALHPKAGSTESGLLGEYFKGRDFNSPPIYTRVDPTVLFRWDRRSPTTDAEARGEVSAEKAMPVDNFSVRWSGVLVPPSSGRYKISLAGDDGFRLDIDGKRVIDQWTTTTGTRIEAVSLDLVGGQAYPIKLEYFEDVRDSEIRLGWEKDTGKTPFEESIEIAKKSDVVVFVGGLTADVEGEEMRVSYPGFAGGDRTDISLPAPQDKLLRALQATGKPVVLVLTAGSALGIEWATKTLPAVVLAWYPGQQGGNAVADILFGDANPSGRLPVTFYKSVEQLPAFDDYGMQGRTYRYFKGEPLFPFGFGLSYTKFEYSNVSVDRREASKRDVIRVSADLRNSGTRSGSEVSQLYVRPTGLSPDSPLRELRGFSRTFLKAGESKRISFELRPDRDFLRYHAELSGLGVAAGEYEIQIGASSQDTRLKQLIQIRP